MNDQLKGLLITTVGVLFVVPDALFVRLIEADALTIAFWRSLLIGSVILIGLAVVHRRALPAQLSSIGVNGLVYAVCAGVSSVLFVTAVTLTTVANAVFIIAAMPVFAAIFSRLVLGETLSLRMIWTIALVLLGLAVIAIGSRGDDASSLAGDLAAFGVAATFAIALTTARRARAVSMIPAIPLAYIGCAIVLLPFVDPLAVDANDWILVALHGGVFMAISTCLLSLGPRYITSSEVALLILMESILAPLLVWFVIDEYPGRWTLIGGAIVLGVLFASNLLALYTRRSTANR